MALVGQQQGGAFRKLERERQRQKDKLTNVHYTYQSHCVSSLNVRQSDIPLAMPYRHLHNCKTHAHI